MNFVILKGHLVKGPRKGVFFKFPVKKGRGGGGGGVKLSKSYTPEKKGGGGGVLGVYIALLHFC